MEQKEYAKLPLVAEMPDRYRDTTSQLLHQLDETVKQRKKLEVIEDDLKDRLGDLQRKANFPGIREGDLCFVWQMVKGRRMLNKDLLLLNGVPAEVIDASMKVGKATERRTFKRLDEVAEVAEVAE
jgi:hypothetical protein